MGDTNLVVDDDTRLLLASHEEHEQLGNDTRVQDSGSGTQKPEKPYPAYFFPQLSQQRAVYCLDVLKREDIRSVCELGCGEGSVIRPMTNGASHSDSFPEPYFEDPVAYNGADHITFSARGRQNTETEVSETTTEETDSASGPSSPQLDSGGETINESILEKYKDLPSLRIQDKELHLRRLAGLDVLEHSLSNAIEATAPPPAEPSPFASYYSFNMGERERWEDLRVEIWQGSLDVYNDSFDNFEAFIMTEVIEHLYDRTLEKFPEILFGSYRPRIIVITTPNYDFNKYFDLGKRGGERADENGEEKAEDETKTSFLDPTGRTERRFRDEDHKFEWTQEEFKEWCDSITSKYDYSVEISGVGSLRNYFGKGGFRIVPEQEEQDKAESKDDTHDQASSSDNAPPSARASSPLPPYVQDALSSVEDPSKFFATQTAVFRRRFAYESERSPRSPMQVPLAFYGMKPARKSSADKSKGEESTSMVAEGSSTGSIANQAQHKLLKTHYYKASADAGNPKSLAEIRAVLDDMMRERMRLRSCSLRELWGRNEVSKACGGYINKIIEAIVQDSAKAWDVDYRPAVLERGGQMEDAVYLILQDFVEPEPDWGDDEEEEDEEDETKVLEKGVKSMWNEGGDDDENEATGTNGHDGSQEDPNKPRKTKKQIKKERLEQLQKEEEERKAQEALNPPEPVWQAEEGDDTWAEWEKNTAKGSLMTEEEWETETKQVVSSGWD